MCLYGKEARVGRTVELLLLDSEDEYLRAYTDNYVGKEFFLYDVPVIFTASDFTHLFSEPQEAGVRIFSKRRARKMLFIKTLLQLVVQVELVYEPETGNFAIFSSDLDCVVYLRRRPATQSLQIATFFDFGKNFTKMYQKQRRKCQEITPEKLKEAVCFGPTTSRNADS